MYDMTSETLEEVKDEPQGEKGEDIIRYKEFGASLFYLQVKTEHAFEEKAERHVPEVEGENAQGERPPSVIDKPDGCYDAREPELKEERPKRKTTRHNYRERLEHWPEQFEVEKSPDTGLRPKEKKKIQGTYKNHKKKRAIAMMMYLQKSRWKERRKVNSGSPVDDCSHNELSTSELIKLGGNSKPLDPVERRNVNENQKMDDYKEERKLPTYKHRDVERINWVESITAQVLEGSEAGQIQKSKEQLSTPPIHHLLGTT